jgi:uncharacterized membrane protein
VTPPLPQYPPPGSPLSDAAGSEAAAPARTLEERIGSNWLIWIGSIALALAGIFLVKYTFDRNLLTPAVRIAMGLLFGVVLLAGGQWLQRSYQRLAQGMSGAGIAVLYASLLAGVNLYDLIPRPVGFAFMALTTAVAVILSLRQGPWIALLGLLGGFLTPALIGSEEPRPGALFSYLFLLQVGLLGVSRRRRWLPIMTLVIVGGMAWAGYWIAVMHAPGDSSWTGTFLIASTALFVVGLRPGRGNVGKPERDVRTALTWLSLGLALLLLAVQTGVAGFSPLEWTFLAVLGAGCLVLARFDADYTVLPYFAAAAGMILLLVWSLDVFLDLARFGAVALLFGLLYAGGSYALMWGARDPRHWAAVSTAAAIGYLLIAYFRIETPPLSVPWGVVCVVVAALYAAAAVPVARRRGRMPGGDMTLAIVALGVTALVSLSVPMELERAWITVAWAVQVAAIAWVHSRLRVPLLPQVAAILAGLVAVRLLLNPAIVFYPIGTTPVWNWLLYGYGIAVVAFAAAAWRFRRSGLTVLSEGLESGALLLGLALVTLEVRHYFHPDGLPGNRFALAELGLLSVLWLLYAWGLLGASERWPHRPLVWGGGGLAVAALGLTVLAQGISENPLAVAHRVGSLPVLNLLLFVYGLPALVALPLARRLQRRRLLPAARFAGAASLYLLFMLVTLEVRQAFQGDILQFRGGTTITNAEWYAYSIAWVMSGIILLLLGIRTRSVVLRYASLIVMLLSVGKVFLFDTAQLVDLYRVFSFLGLGASLLFLGFLYQRFVFRTPAR